MIAKTNLEDARLAVECAGPGASGVLGPAHSAFTHLSIFDLWLFAWSGVLETFQRVSSALSPYRECLLS